MRSQTKVRQTHVLFLVGLICAMPGCEDHADVHKAPTSQRAPEEIVRTAENGPLKVTITADRDRVEVPEPVKLTIHVEAEVGVEVGVPKLEGLIGEFGVADMVENDVPCGDYALCKRWIYTLDTFLPGEQEIPPLTFSFRDGREKADGSSTVYEDTVMTEPIAIRVTQALADIKDPVGLATPFRYRLLWWAVGAVAAMILIALVVRWWRRQRPAQPAMHPFATRIAAHTWALGELDRLAQEDLIGRGLVQEFYYRINGLLRRYIELRFELMAGEQTSEEFIRALQHSDFLSAGHKDMLRQFVASCDPVKYAQHRPETDEIEWVQTSARQFVLQTAHDPAEPKQSDLQANTTQEAAA
ncbi:MAG: hypothetical protein MI923_24045 [Phycisphaerales bacterium]|nr:hypothetical protein [Phycisphaerales bacterium]